MKTISQFEVAHIQLKDGGDGIPSILLPERTDLLNEWQLVDEAWNEFKEFQTIFTPADSRQVKAKRGARDACLCVCVKLEVRTWIRGSRSRCWFVHVFFFWMGVQSFFT